MAAVYATLLIEEIEERAAAIEEPIRDRSNPFEYMSEQKFIKKFRVNKEIASYLVENLKDELKSERIPPFIKILLALNFYGTGSYQESVSEVLKVSQPTVSRSVDEVTKAINKILLNHIIRFPTPDEQQHIKQRFYDKYGIPGTIGTIDCTHIEIIKPKNMPNDSCNRNRSHCYINRKGFYSLNVQMIADDNLMIRSITARYPGSVHDAFIWRYSDVRTYLLNNFTRNSSTWLLGDSGYPLEPWLLTPFPDPDAGTVQERFNRRHASARNGVERCFGVLKSRFRCLSRHRVLHYAPTKASLIVNACAVIHNLCRQYGLELDNDEPLHPDDLLSIFTNCNINNNNLLTVARGVRHRIAITM